MHPYRIYNSFAELAAANGVFVVNNTAARSTTVRTNNSELAALIQDYDRIVRNLESTESLIATAAQTAQPEVQAELIRPKTKYETELLKAKQKIVDALQTTSVDDFDRSILSAASQKTKSDLTQILANKPLPEQTYTPSQPLRQTPPPMPPPPPEQDHSPNIM